MGEISKWKESMTTLKYDICSICDKPILHGERVATGSTHAHGACKPWINVWCIWEGHNA